MPRPCWSSSISLSAVVLPARRAEEHGDTARVCFEGDVVDGGRKVLTGVAGQSEGLDHPQQDSALCPFFGYPAAEFGRSDFRTQHGRVEQGGAAGPEELGRPAALAGGGAAGGDQEPGVPVTLRWKLRGSRATFQTAS